MKIFKIIILFFIVNTSFTFSQSNFKFGIITNIGASSLYGNSMTNMESNVESELKYSMKTTIGLGAKAQYSLNEKWAINLNTSYQQRGAKFDKGIYSYTPRYNFNYLDLAVGISYQTKEILKKTKLFFNLNGGYNILLNSERKNNFESYDLMNESKMSDFGASLHVGLNIPRVDKDLIQLSIFANTGIQNVFGGYLLENGQVGKNISFGLQVGYLFGK